MNGTTKADQLSSKGGAYTGTGKQGQNEFRKDIGSYASTSPFFVKAFDALRLGERTGPIIMIDAMAGPGKFGLDIRKTHHNSPNSKTKIWLAFNDIKKEPLMKINEEADKRGEDPYATIQCDICELNTAEDMRFIGKVDIVTVRYGLKDLPKGHAQVALEAMRQTIADDGMVLVADMFAKSKEGQYGVNLVHAKKQELAGRNEQREGVCHIPTLEEWQVYFLEAGFKPKFIYGTTSDVNTKNWTGQFVEDVSDPGDFKRIAMMDDIIKVACARHPEFQTEFQVSFASAHREITLKFPIFVMVGEKA